MDCEYQVILTMPGHVPEYISRVFTDLREALDALHDELERTGEAQDLPAGEVREAKKLVNTIEVEKCIMLGGYEHKLVRVADEVERFPFRERNYGSLDDPKEGSLGEIAGRVRQLSKQAQCELLGCSAWFHPGPHACLVVRFPFGRATELYDKLLSLVWSAP